MKLTNYFKRNQDKRDRERKITLQLEEMAQLMNDIQLPTSSYRKFTSHANAFHNYTHSNI